MNFSENLKCSIASKGSVVEAVLRAKRQMSGSRKMIPTYPPLNRCLLIESRHQSRAQTKRMLESSNLFSTLVEALSLSDALHRLQAQDYDTCLVGPSVSPDSASKFVQAARKISRSKDCAFLVIVPDTVMENVPGADAVLKSSCSRKDLYERTVAVIANQQKNSSSPKSVVVRKTSSTEYGTEYLIEHQARRLARIQRNVQRGRLGLNSLGRPDSNTDNELRKLVDGLLFKRVEPTEFPAIRKALLTAFREWVVMLVIGSHAEANEQLQSALKMLLVDSKPKQLAA